MPLSPPQQHRALRASGCKKIPKSDPKSRFPVEFPAAPPYLPVLHSDVGGGLVEDVIPPVEGELLGRVVTHLRGKKGDRQGDPSKSGQPPGPPAHPRGAFWGLAPSRHPTHPRAVAFHLHPEGLADAVLLLAQPLACGQRERRSRGLHTPNWGMSRGGAQGKGPKGSPRPGCSVPPAVPLHEG